jgi:hypothetical protein
MATTNIQAFSGDVEIAGGLNITGTVTSTVGVDKVNLAEDGTDASRRIIFTTGSTGAQPLKTDAGLTYNPSTNQLTVAGGLSTSVTPGSYLTGSAYNGSTARTFAVDATTTNTASKIVARDSNGDIFGRYFQGEYVNISHTTGTRNSDTIFYSSTDAYIRKNNASGMRSSLGLANSATITASADRGNDTIVRRSPYGYVFANYFNTTPDDVSSGITKVCVETGNDGYIRHGTQAGVRSFLGLGDYAYKGNGANITRTSFSSGYMIGFQNGGSGGSDTKTNPIYTIGTSHLPNDTSLGDMYGIGYSHGNFTSLLTGGWGMYVASDGDVRIGLNASSGHIKCTGHVYCGNTMYIGGSTDRGLRSVSGDYGTVQTTGTGVNDWEGYSVDGRWVIMSDDASANSHLGIYNDMDNEWAIYCYRNGPVSLYWNGQEKSRTEATGLYMLGTPEMDNYLRHRNDNNTYMGFPDTDRWGVWTSGSERLRVASTGGLRVYGTEADNVNYGSGNRGYFKGGITTDPPSLSFGLFVNSYIRSFGHVSFSDRRMKSNIVDINDTYALDQLRGLKPKYYNYVDTKAKGDESVIGFIAQEVNEVVPRAVSIVDGEIPNIYTHANITSNNTVTFTDFNTSNLESNATIIVYDRGTVRKELEIAEIVDEHTIRFTDDISDLGCSFDENGNVISVTETITLTPEEYTEAGEPSDCTSNVIGYRSSSNVVSIEEYELLTVKATYSPVVDFYTRVVTTYPGTEIFIWGQIVNDFHHLNKDYLWTIGTAALQEVDRQQQADKLRISELETQLTSVLTRLDALESA